ncbi:Crp/Fnr family transcriptional regulator [Spongiivirga sp. MCCC 1A20706]|uniref:Crp/Fnr family transcriptional regulator n=1 Tax=Spongiivirga sp. MCCC 1A20706 TaxID=3160963 RepID=UPI00397735B5
MDAFKEYLQQYPNYKPSDFDAVLPYLSIKEVDAGEYLLRQGKICKHIAFIESGLFRLYYLNDGKEVTNCFCKENTLTTSYSSLILQKPSDIAIQAIEPSRLIILSNDSLQKLYKTHSFWQQLGRIAAENEFITTEEHNRFLKDVSATNRYQLLLEKDKQLLQRVPLNYLATYLQITPETLSRIRNKLART